MKPQIITDSFERKIIIGTDDQFKTDQKYLEKELNEIKDGKATYLTVDDLEKRLENTIKKHEDNL